MCTVDVLRSTRARGRSWEFDFGRRLRHLIAFEAWWSTLYFEPDIFFNLKSEDRLGSTVP